MGEGKEGGEKGEGGEGGGDGGLVGWCKEEDRGVCGLLGNFLF